MVTASADDARYAVLARTIAHGEVLPQFDPPPPDTLRTTWLVPTSERGHIEVGSVILEAIFESISWAPRIRGGGIPTLGLSRAVLDDRRDLDHSRGEDKLDNRD
jgi:hypothetical protein